MKRVVLFFIVVMVIFFTNDALLYAQGSAALRNGLEAGYNELRGTLDIIRKFMYAIAGIIGMIGAIKVYGKWSEGAPDTAKTAGLWFGGVAFFIIAGIIIDRMFLN